MQTEVLGKCVSALFIAAIAACFFVANGMFYEALVIQLNEWAAGKHPLLGVRLPFTADSLATL